MTTPERTAILQQYQQLVAEYHRLDYLFEQVEQSDDEDEFNVVWRRLDKAHQHMVNFKDKHKITRSELTEWLGGVKVGSVDEAVMVLGGKLDKEKP